jgi:hypothetical protein
MLAGPVFTDARYNRYYYGRWSSRPHAPRVYVPGRRLRRVAVPRSAFEALSEDLGQVARYDTARRAIRESPRHFEELLRGECPWRGFSASHPGVPLDLADAMIERLFTRCS